MSYAELFINSNFSFLIGASHAEELVLRASELALGAIAITDKNTFAGVVRGHAAAKELGVSYIVGVQLVLNNGSSVLAYPKNRVGYGNLCRLLTIGKRRTTKGECDLELADLLEWGGDCILITVSGITSKAATMLKETFGSNVYIGMVPYYDGEDEYRFTCCAKQAEKLGLSIVALGNVLMHHGQRRKLADILSCIREKTSIDKLGRLAQPNAERRLKSEFEIRRVFKRYPEALQNTAVIAERCQFSLEQLKYEYPDEVTDGMQPDERLRQLTESGLHRRYPDGPSLKVRSMVEKELNLISELNYARYFLTAMTLLRLLAAKASFVKGAVLRRTQWFVMRLVLPKLHQKSSRWCLNALFPQHVTSRLILMWILSTKGVKKLFSIFTRNMGGIALVFAQPLFIFVAALLFEKLVKPWVCRKILLRHCLVRYGALPVMMLARNALALPAWI